MAPIVATEGATGAVIAVLLGASLSAGAAVMLGVIVVGVVLSTLEPRKDVPAGDFDVVVDAIDEPSLETDAQTTAPDPTDQVSAAPTVDDPALTRRTAVLAMAAAVVFGIGLVASGQAASFVPVAWVALSARLIGLVAVVLPLLLQRRMRVTRAALPLVLIAGTAEVLGSMLGAWGSRESIPVDRRDGQSVRRVRCRRRVRVLRRTPRSAPDHRRRRHRRRHHGPRGTSGLTAATCPRGRAQLSRYTAAS